MKHYQDNIDLSIEEIEKFIKSRDQKVQFTYIGAFDETNLLLINQYINFVESLNYELKRTNLFKIFIELTQNISQNSTITKTIDGKNIGCGKLTIREFEDCYVMVSSNMAEKGDADYVVELCNEINRKSSDELRQMKRERIREQTSKRQNGNIGLIKIAIITKSKLKVQTKTISNDEVFISISTILKK
jgi:hypothetical protein